MFKYTNYCARLFSYWQFSFRSLLLLVCSAIGCQPILMWPPALVSLKLQHTWAFSSIIITMTPSHPKGLIVKQRTFFLEALPEFTSQPVLDDTPGHLVTLTSTGLWPFVMVESEYLLFTLELSAPCPVFSSNTHSLCDEFLIIV